MFCAGGEIVSTFDMPDSVKLGHCDLIEEVMIGEDRLIKFSGKLYFCLSTSNTYLLYSSWLWYQYK